MSGVTVYIMVGLVTLATLHWAAAKSSFQSRAKRGILGTSSGGLSYGILSEWTSTASILDASISGALSWYGWFFATGFFALVAVWGWNLISTRKYLVM